MYTFKWSELVTDSLFSLLNSNGETITADSKDKIKDIVASIFKSVGGLPVSKNEFDENQKSDLAEKLFSEALDRYLHLVGIKNRRIGYYLKKSNNAYQEDEIIGMKQVFLNNAGIEELSSLPLVGNKVAAEIISERTTNGYFESLDDFTNRIKGLGEKSKEILGNILLFADPTDRTNTSVDFQHDLVSKFKIAFDAYKNDSQKSALLGFLDNFACILAKKPHPKTSSLEIRDNSNYEPIATSQTEWISLLEGTQYYKSIPDIIQSANTSIRLAMFHVALPKENHPTRLLLDELIAAQKRGVEVKVILDKDRETDLYRSTIINQAAKDYLNNNGVSCKFDKADVLLHSKYLVVDDTYCVIGSHNWSAGSFFQFDDLSFIMSSTEIAKQLRNRFEKLWIDL